VTRKLFVAIILFILTLAGKLIVDLHLYFSGGVNNHVIGPAIVLVSLAGCSILAGWRSIPMWFLNYWILFNGLYAVFIHQSWGYLGTTSKLDIFESEHGWVTILKYILAVASIIYYIVSIKKIKK